MKIIREVPGHEHDDEMTEVWVEVSHLFGLWKTTEKVCKYVCKTCGRISYGYPFDGLM